MTWFIATSGNWQIRLDDVSAVAKGPVGEVRLYLGRTIIDLDPADSAEFKPVWTKYLASSGGP